MRSRLIKTNRNSNWTSENELQNNTRMTTSHAACGSF